MRRSSLLIVAAFVPLVAGFVYLFGGPQIDASHVVVLDDLMPMAMPCLHYQYADHRGWPIWRAERAYLRFLQDDGVRIAFMPSDDGSYYSALIGFFDSLRIRKLHEEARESGLSIPKSAFSSRIE